MPRPKKLSFLVTGILLAWFGLSRLQAAEVEVTGSAVIGVTGLGEAREVATRRAWARAAEFYGARVNSRSQVNSGVLEDHVQVAADACLGQSQSLGEKVLGNELTVTLRVQVSERDECRKACVAAYRSRILTGAFALEYPEQKTQEELGLLSVATALQLAKRIEKRGRVLAAHESGFYPYQSPARAPQLKDENNFAAAASARRAQYVVSGVYRDLGIVGGDDPGGVRRHVASTYRLLGGGDNPVERRRPLVVEVFLHDAVTGEVVAQKTLSRTVIGDVQMPPARVAAGSAAFLASDFGAAWSALLDDIAAWSEEQVACQAFSVRVLKVNGRLLHVDAGSEAGLAAGDSLVLSTFRDPGVQGLAGQSLGRERLARVQALIREVYPRFAVVELRDPPPKLVVKPGDVLYSR